MKAALLVVLLVACGEDPKPKVDGGVTVIDSKLIDAPKPIDAAVDAAPDATPMNITTACTNVCTALAVCVMEPLDQECVMGCSEDLFDCTAAQIMAVDACRTQACGDLNEMSPLIQCLEAITCINPATGGGSLADWSK
ncbi:MAG TPA: hypothetical protein VIV11_10395 [Kofleriaceae bacterium]